MRTIRHEQKTCLVYLLAVISYSSGYKIFQTKIPNGDRVTNPCDHTVWQGVGHLNKQGGGDRNAFGKAFHDMGSQWTEELCNADSDGDGLSNGQELGDPQCQWEVGETPPRTINITHPGICEPLDSPKCQKQEIKCLKDWSCPAIHQPDVTELNITIPRTKVPDRVTTYICYNKKIPSDKVYDIIASRTVIDNENVNHHMTMYGCSGDIPEGKDNSVDACQLREAHCNKMVHIWSLGMEPHCQPDYKAFRIGKGLTTWVSIQFHWNNPHKISTYTDSSGVQIYYTPKLRKYAEDIMQTGDGAIYIPPHSKDFKVRGLCSHDCSKKTFAQPFNISSILLHMHGHGRSMWAKHYRDGYLLKVLAEDKPYRYDRPVIHRFEEHPIEFRPGDELQVECTFDTTGNDRWVINGPGTEDEMCLTLISYYPANEFKMENCFSVNERCGSSDKDFAPGCDLKSLQSNLISFTDDILKHCAVSEGLTCPRVCSQIIDWIKYQNMNCFDNQPKPVSRFIWGSVIPSMFTNETVSQQITNSFKGCDLYRGESDIDNDGYHWSAM